MNYWIFADTHFGHKSLLEKAGRPEHFERIILKRARDAVWWGDVVIHLGDVSTTNHLNWHRDFIRATEKASACWLVRGNHDDKSIAWYLRQGWDAVMDRMDLELYGFNFIFSHEPVKFVFQDEDEANEPANWRNVHGHLHNPDRTPEWWPTPYHQLMKMEHTYRPVSLKEVAHAFGRRAVPISDRG